MKAHTPEEQLLLAVGRWVKSAGGRAVVIGGIRIEFWPGDGEYVYHVAIKCTGRPPTTEAPPKEAQA